MAAQDCFVEAIEIPNPSFYPSNLPPEPINSSLGFQHDYSTGIQTLSANNPQQWDSIKGLLYVPDLGPDEQCNNYTRSLIPKNVTRYDNLPPDSWAGVALAPWTADECVYSFLREVDANPWAIALIFYLPDDSTEKPPVITNPVWNNTNDHVQISFEQNYPIYAIPGAAGASLMQQLALYSGNLTDVPHGDQLVRMYDARNYVRLWTRIDVNMSTGIPSLWVFLIIVLAILLGVILFTSVLMHLFQARRRRSLQRRVARGEVDLEALGIKRLNVPQSILDKMPQYIYTSREEGPGSPSGGEAQLAPQGRQVPRSQPTCPICLDDFTNGETMVRELPCSHIFHPECIDPFLKENSSLCPMCKKSALPPGYCPVQVTNLMVRRERLIRRLRERVSVDQEVRRVGREMDRLDRPRSRLSAAFTGLGAGMTRVRQSAAANRSPETDEIEPPSSPLAITSPAIESPAIAIQDFTPPPEVERQGTSARRAWRRERLARAQQRRYEARAQGLEDTRPKWRRAVGRVLPVLD